METLRKLRIEKKLTQQQAADLAGVSLRSYISYETEQSKADTLKYCYLAERLAQYNPIDEEHGILELEDIWQKCAEVFDRYEVQYCYLFGSYAKGKATGKSDVDLLISTETVGLKYFGLVEELRAALHKKVDALDSNQLRNNYELTQEILKDGIKIYG